MVKVLTITRGYIVISTLHDEATDMWKEGMERWGLKIYTEKTKSMLT